MGSRPIRNESVGAMAVGLIGVLAAGLVLIGLAACDEGTQPAREEPTPAPAAWTEAPVPTPGTKAPVAVPPTETAGPFPVGLPGICGVDFIDRAVGTPRAPLDECSIHPVGGFNDVWQTEKWGGWLGCPLDPGFSATGTEVYWCSGLHTLWIKQREGFILLEPTCAWIFLPDTSGLPTEARLIPWQEQGRTPTPSMATLAPDAPTPLPTVLLMPLPTLTPGMYQRTCGAASGRHASLISQPAWVDSWDSTVESGEGIYEGTMEQFGGGWLLWNGYQCFVLFNNGRWEWCGGNSKP